MNIPEKRTPRAKRAKRARNEEICGTIMAFLPVLRCILFSLVPMALALDRKSVV